ncbi:retrovirus-related pol polyprotein from transposon TNT 1-94 [Tanacetum coccineum]
MMDVFELMKSDLDATWKQNEILNDQLLEATLKHDVEKCVLMCSDSMNYDLNNEIEKVKRESIDVQENLLKRIKILKMIFKDVKNNVLRLKEVTSVRRPLSRGSSSKNSVLSNTKNHSEDVEVHVRPNKKTNVTFKQNVVQIKKIVTNVDVKNALKAKDVLCVSCDKNMLTPCHDKYLAKYKFPANSKFRRALFTTTRTTKSKSLDTTPIVAKTRFAIVSPVIQLILWIVDSGYSKHMTGNLKLLKHFVEKFMGTVRFRNDHFATIMGYGDYVHGNITICHVYYVEGLGYNLFSVGQFCDDDLEIAFRSKTCYVRNMEGDYPLTGCSLLTLLIKASFKWTSKQHFLNGPLKEDVYVSQPDGFVDPDFPDHVYKLKKALYCLKQALRAWYNKLSSFLIEHHFTKARLDADLQGTPTDQTKYCSMIGGLMYLTATRPDIAFATFVCVHYLARTTVKHLKEVKRIFQYLRRTYNMGLWYPKDSGFDLIAYSDVEHIGCHDDCKSMLGGLQFLGEKLVCWSSKKQDYIAMSTAKTVYVSLSACCAQVIWMRTKLLDYGYKFNKILTYCNSNSAIAISCNPVQHSQKRFDLWDANKKFDLINPQCPNESKILADILNNHPLRLSIAGSALVPWIYNHQVWHTLKMDDAKEKFKFFFDTKELTLTIADFRCIFQLPQPTDTNNTEIIVAPSFSQMLPFFG